MVSAQRATTRWVTRSIPFFLIGFVGFTSYVVVQRICLDFFLTRQQKPGTATAFLVVYSLTLLLALIAYLRVLFVIIYNPGVVPLGPNAVTQREENKKTRRMLGRQDDIEAKSANPPPDENPDSPGLEAFYSKDVFVCNEDGRPKWCASCCNWKPDRAHHCSELERCCLKMDHFCPWVGGIVGEPSYKFFTQFTFYATLYWGAVIAATAFALQQSKSSGAGIDGFYIGALGLGCFFVIFTFTMTGTAVRYICMNLTNVDYLKSKVVVHCLAIRVPQGTPPGPNYGIITYPLPRQDDRAPSPNLSGQTVTENNTNSPRDLLASRSFAIVKTQIGENPWDLGPFRNWKSVMGNNIIDWLLPINIPPNYVSNESMYEMGPLYPELRRRYGLPDIEHESKTPG
ncbi:DHHC palmitoyltransferase-domain-containing protein [Rhypophila decipiens]|uniref:Palmitoyltransferase n=1 Tax=Rhypophila decipiens TaxID=261697 RepID=A0AAN7B9J6_9PEZI|nr:DHHC palmitoyltransferase-domain-containing protein [Rhypophila decipiens]